MTTEAQRRAMKRYYERTKRSYKVIMLRLSKTDDKDVIKAFEEVPSKVDYVRALVREDIARKGER